MVEGDGDDQVLLAQAVELVIDQDCLPTAGPAHQQDRPTVAHEEVKEVAEPHCLRRVHQHSLERETTTVCMPTTRLCIITYVYIIICCISY